MPGRNTRADAELPDRLNRRAEQVERYRLADIERRRQERIEDAARVQAAWATEAARVKALDDARAKAERTASDGIVAQRQARHLAQQAAQASWKIRSLELEAAVVEIRGQLRSAQGRVLSAPLADACIAAAEIAVYERRLAAAERAVESHARSQPRAYA